MKRLRQRIITICFAHLLPFAAFSAAPVVDESENYSQQNRQNPQAVNEVPLAQDITPSRPAPRDMEYPDEKPLARDTTPRIASNQDASIPGRIQSLQQEVQELRGMLEVQAHELTLLREQQLRFYKDIDSRLKGSKSVPLPMGSQPALPPSTQPMRLSTNALHSKPTKTAALYQEDEVAGFSTPQSNNPADEQVHYLKAYDLVKTKQVDKAISAMQAFTTQHPQSSYAPHAHYWLGELYLTQKDYSQALNQFDTVIQQYPTSAKSADSLFGLGCALAGLGNKKDAIDRFNQVIHQYPDTQTAKLAQTKLQSLRS